MKDINIVTKADGNVATEQCCHDSGWQYQIDIGRQYRFIITDQSRLALRDQ